MKPSHRNRTGEHVRWIVFRRCARLAGLLVLWVVTFTSLRFWIASHTHGEAWRHYDRPRDFELYSVDGLVQIAWGTMIAGKYPPPAGWTYTGSLSCVSSPWQGTVLGFRIEHRVRQSPDLTANTWGVCIPYWFICALFALPMIWMTRTICRDVRIRRRLRNGLCPACGYDLRASPDANGPLLERCPECGTTVEHKRVSPLAGGTDEHRAEQVEAVGGGAGPRTTGPRTQPRTSDH